MNTTEPLLRIEDLVVTYRASGRRAGNRVLDGISLQIGAGECVGLVGESGSGKSTLGRAVLGLAPVTAGSISFDGRRIDALGRRGRRALAADIQVVFQDPYTSLNPSMSVGDILAEPIRAAGLKRVHAASRVRELLEQVDLPADAESRFPRQFSGGQRQRIAIARALALEPRLIICDEPLSALDLSTQARVMDLLIGIQERTGVSYLFISHDLQVVREMCHRVAVMFRGRLVETGEADQVTASPEHPYTRQLMLAAPVADPVVQAERRRERSRLAQTVNPAA
ncbi:ATP-binding cassette domain-containing protein [Labedella endophytica]|uniref:ABC transporter ATP-binding protein n=1 Tax=Labedella endophytica TaxID=1523160 RepID=A0A433JUI1_9MICO|nr:ATP-binding cassette domain-containing protein [Labedella endophytica]RUR01803.1 ABC transporter ATP-binding protein [Labedella endophytica]